MSSPKPIQDFQKSKPNASPSLDSLYFFRDLGLAVQQFPDRSFSQIAKERLTVAVRPFPSVSRLGKDTGRHADRAAARKHDQGFDGTWAGLPRRDGETVGAV